MTKEELQKALLWNADMQASIRSSYAISIYDGNGLMERLEGELEALEIQRQAAENWLMILNMDDGDGLRTNYLRDPHAYKWIAVDRDCNQYLADCPEEALKKAGFYDE